MTFAPGRAVLGAAYLLAAAVALPASGCARKPPPDGREVYSLRNLARLEASRDTQEGHARAADIFRKICEDREDPGDLLNLARCLVLSGSAAEAESTLERALHLLPAGAEHPVDLIYLRALALKHQNRFDAAADQLREVARRDPALDAGWYQLGTVLFGAKRYEESIDAFSRLLELRPDHSSAEYKRSMAYRHLGRAEEADASLARFQSLQKTAAAPVTEDAAYERCRYTRVTLVPPAGTRAQDPPVELRFASATAGSGLPASGAGAVALLDAERDGDPDLYILGRERNRILRNEGGRYSDVTDLSDAVLPGSCAGAESADFNNDSITDLLVLDAGGSSALLKGLGHGVFRPFPESGLAIDGLLEALWMDHDHDGDLDLIAAERSNGGAALRVHRNSGDETFSEDEGRLPASFASSPGSIVMADFDRGNDMDIAVADPSGPARLFLNLRSGPFRVETLPALAGHARIAAADLNNDGSFDLVAAPWKGTPLRVALSAGDAAAGHAPRFTVMEPPGAPPGDAGSLLVADVDADGDLDALQAGPPFGLVYLRNEGGRLAPAVPGGIPLPVSSATERLAAPDFDGDGRLDLLLLGKDGEPTLWRAEGGHASITLRLGGGRDNRDGVGAHVEVFAGERYQRLLCGGPAAAGGVQGVRIGLAGGSLSGLDGIEVLWPNGIEQPLFPADLKAADSSGLSIVQKRGLDVSCPYLFTHDGKRWRFLTDVVGIAPLDEWLPPGATPHLDPEEYVRIPADHLGELEERLHLAITEELRETTYLDRVRLVRVTHPRGTVLQNDESTRQGDMEPLSLWVFRSGDVLAPAAVRGPRGDDGLELAARADGRYLHAYLEAPSQWAGWAPPSTLVIDPPGCRETVPALLLLLTGRIYWPDSSVMYALAQHGRAWDPPALASAGPAGGERVRILDDIGFPAGMDRTLAIPLPGGLPRGSSLALSSSYRFLWDRIAFVSGAVLATIDAPPAAGEVSLEVEVAGMRVRLGARALALASARLGHHGYSRAVGDFELHEQTYDFDGAEPFRRFRSPSGNATRFGDVAALLAEPDSLLAVIAPGDGLQLEFEPGPAPAPGEDVTYFLQVTGWAKESSFHNPTGRTIAPLPIHGRPYPPGVPPDGLEPARRQWLEEYQTRSVGSEG